MSKEFITQHLVRRHICGYKITDPTYKEIKEYLMHKLEPCKKTQFILTAKLLEYLGPYNTITAGIYIDLAVSFYWRCYHKRPSTEALFNTI